LRYRAAKNLSATFHSRQKRNRPLGQNHRTKNTIKSAAAMPTSLRSLWAGLGSYSLASISAMRTSLGNVFEHQFHAKAATAKPSSYLWQAFYCVRLQTALTSGELRVNSSKVRGDMLMLPDFFSTHNKVGSGRWFTNARRTTPLGDLKPFDGGPMAQSILWPVITPNSLAAPQSCINRGSV